MKKTLLISAFALSSMLNADYLLEYKMDNEIQKFMYHDASLSKLVTASDDGSTVYKIGKKSYIVTGKGKNKTVVDVDEMRAMANSFGYDPSEYNPKESFHPHIKKTSKRVTIAGVKGYVWRVQLEDGDKFEEIVVTNDKRVVNTMRAMTNMFASMSGIDTGENDMFEIEKGYIVIKADGVELHAFKEKHIDSSEYALPTDAKKQSMPKFDKKNLEALEKGLEELAKEAQKAQKKVTKEPKEDDEPEIDTQKAVNLLKSFF